MRLELAASDEEANPITLSLVKNIGGGTAADVSNERVGVTDLLLDAAMLDSNFKETEVRWKLTNLGEEEREVVVLESYPWYLKPLFHSRNMAVLESKGGVVVREREIRGACETIDTGWDEDVEYWKRNGESAGDGEMRRWTSLNSTWDRSGRILFSTLFGPFPGPPLLCTLRVSLPPRTSIVSSLRARKHLILMADYPSNPSRALPVVPFKAVSCDDAQASASMSISSVSASATMSSRACEVIYSGAVQVGDTVRVDPSHLLFCV